MKQISLFGQEFSYQIKRNAKSKRISLRIKQPDYFEITIPKWLKEKKVDEFLNEYRDKIWHKIQIFKKRYNNELVKEYKDGVQVPFLGKYYLLKIEKSQEKDFLVNIKDESITVFLPKADYFAAENTSETVKKVLEQWYRLQARDIITQRLEHYNKFYQLSYNRISIKDQKTRWGSCSSLKNLNFSWRLVLAPLNMLDYVVVHELVHLRELNHSAAFWHNVSLTIPDYQERKKWLKDNGNLLTF